MPEYSHEQNLRLAQKVLEQQGEINDLRERAERAEQAEAAIERVRALAERWRYTPDRKHGPLRELRNAIRGPRTGQPVSGHSGYTPAQLLGADDDQPAEPAPETDEETPDRA